MPEKLPAGVEISISRRSLPSDYKMPTMDMSTDHYSVGFLVSGDRRTITAQQSYDAHAGDVSMMPPYVYHRTVSLSTAPYESFLVKFSPRAAEPLVALMGPAYLSDLMEQKIHHFSSMIQAKLLALFEDMVTVYASGAPYSSLILQGQLLRLLTLIHEEHTGHGADYFPSQLSRAIIDTLARIEQQYAEELRLSTLAESLGYSQAHLSRLFRQQLGSSFTEYLTRVRLRHVCDMLIHTDQSISDIALACGFCNGDYLSARFHAGFGMSPREFRRQVRISAPSHIQ